MSLARGIQLGGTPLASLREPADKGFTVGTKESEKVLDRNSIA
jgi:hypothetical protein